MVTDCIQKVQLNCHLVPTQGMGTQCRRMEPEIPISETQGTHAHPFNCELAKQTKATLMKVVAHRNPREEMPKYNF